MLLFFLWISKGCLKILFTFYGNMTSVRLIGLTRRVNTTRSSKAEMLAPLSLITLLKLEKKHKQTEGISLT